jgi:pimeloyl-ACP methyl ester carboxylesterase
MTKTDAVLAQPPIPAGFVQSTADVGRRRIRYLEGGRGEVLLVVHGGSGLLGNMSSVHAELAKEHRVVALELPGFGDSDATGVESLHDLAGIVADFAQTVGAERYSLRGSSIGAAVALWVAIDNPDAVDKLVLDGPAAFREGSPPPGPPPGGRRGPAPAHVAFMQEIVGPPTDPALVAAMAACEVPALVMFGQDDPFFPPRFAADYKRLPRAGVAIVYAAGHDIKASRPAAYLTTVSDFLRRGPGFVVAESSTLIHA